MIPDAAATLGPPVMWIAIWLAVSTTAAVVVERLAAGIGQARRRRLAAHYGPLVQRALEGDTDAQQTLAACPRRHRLPVAALLILPLAEDRRPAPIASARRVVDAMALPRDAERMLTSRRWWHRAVALRALGLLQDRRYTAQAIAALGDPSADVRTAALDALADLRDPASLTAIVARLFDTTLHRGRRVAALAAFGGEAEALLLELAAVDATNRVAYARALSICGTAAARPLLRQWAVDSSSEVRAAAFAALEHTGLDADAAALAVRSLEAPEVRVRAAAAHALAGWTRGSDAATRLARHLDDDWAVAASAARALKTMGPAGESALLAASQRPDLAGTLARQMLWRPEARA